MAMYSLRNHTERLHGIVLPQIRGVDVRGGSPETYKVSFLPILKLTEFLVEGCPEKENTPGRLRENFMYQHWKLKAEKI